MKYFILILLIINPLTDLDKIAKVNKTKKEARQAYLDQNYQLAHDSYKFLIDSMGVKEDEVLLDFAHTQYQLKDTTNAVTNYQQLTQSANATIASVAEQQLGQMFFDKKQYEPALEHFKNALRKNPSNQEARYNYELLKKLIQEQKDQQQNQDQNQDKQDQQNQDKQDQNKDQQKKEEQNKDQENKDQQEQKDQEKQDEQQQKDQEKKDQEKNDQEKKDGKEDKDKEQNEEQKDKQQQEGEKSEEEKKKEQPQPTASDKLKEMNISEEKAKMILEAMKNNEIQYIQQNKRKATKRKDNGKPDW